MKFKILSLFIILINLFLTTQGFSASAKNENEFNFKMTQYDKIIKYDNGLEISLELSLGGGAAFIYPDEWDNKTIVEIRNLEVSYLKDILGEDSERFHELKTYLDSNVKLYKDLHLDNVPYKDLNKKLLEIVDN